MLILAKNFIVLALIVLFLAECREQADNPVHLEQITLDEIGTCDVKQLERLPVAWNVGLGYTFVILDGAKLVRGVGEPSESVRTKINPFEKVRVLGFDDSSNKTLVSLREGSVCGWLEKNSLLNPSDISNDGPKPLRVRDGLDRAWQPDNTLNIKVLLQNRDTGSIPIYLEPSAPRPMEGPRGGGGLFNVYEVFAIKEAVYPQGKNRHFYLIGRNTSSTNNGLLGWVSDENIFQWDNRVAAFWRGSVEARGYRTEESFLAQDKNIITFSLKEIQRSDSSITPRFPVLEQKPPTKAVIEGIADKSISDIYKKIRYYAVAVPSRTESSASDERQSNGAGWQPSQRAADILFLIDATQSMTQYSAFVAQNIEAFIKTIEPTGNTIRVGVAVYGDYTGKEASEDQLQYRLVVPFVGLRDSGLSAQLNKLNKFTTYHDEQGDRLEATFAAIVRATKEKWEPAAQVRLIVHIGDHGNRRKGHTSEEYSPQGKLLSSLIEKIDEVDVVTALRKEKVFYVPIAVRGDFVPEANAAFREQAEKLYQLEGRRVKKLAITYELGAQSESEQDRNRKIFEAIEGSVKIYDFLEREPAANEPSGLRGKRHESAEASYDSAAPDWKRFAATICQDYDDRNMEPRPPYCAYKESVDKYYFSPLDQKTNEPTFTFWIALYESELMNLFNAADELCHRIEVKGLWKHSLGYLMERELEDASGDAGKPSELFEKQFFIPAIYLNPLLRKPWGKIQAELTAAHERGDDALINDLKMRSCRSSYSLALVLAGKRNDEPEWNSAGHWEDPNNKERHFNWKWHVEGGLDLYYIPVEYLP